MDCAGIALLAWSLFGGEAQRPARAQGLKCPGRVLLAGLGALLAGLSKETALFAALGVGLASLFPAGRVWQFTKLGRAQLAPALASAAGVALALVARAAVLADMKKTADSLSLMHDLPRALARLLGVALGSVLLPTPRTMLNLGYRLAQPSSALELALLGASAALVAWLAWTRRVRACVLISTAAAMVAPCVLVRHAFWLGCDRYLYVPLLLVCLALGAPAIEERSAALRPSLRRAGAAAWLLALSLSTFATSQTYHGQTEHMLALIHQRPGDPTGRLVGARWLWHAGNKDGARALIDRVPRSGLPPPLASQLATRLGGMGRTREALAVVAEMERSHPDDPYVQLDVLAVQLDQGRISQAAAHAAALRSYPTFCRAARALIEEHVRHPGWDPLQRREGNVLLAGYFCE
jgi:hypothetical protein